MVQLRRTADEDQHLYLRVGPSTGTKQVKEVGATWLKKQGYSLPSPGGGVKLDPGDYQYLDKRGYLYVKGEEHTTSSAQPLLLLSPEAVHYGAPLLLLLADPHESINDAEWTLILKLDEWEEKARDALLQHHAAAVGCYAFETSISIFSSISLQQIRNANYWPEVAPQITDYALYWQSSEQYQENSLSSQFLREATPPTGLKAGWQGNVFFRFKGNGLTNTWQRYLPGMSISANNFKEFYWLAESNQKPEPAWPGKVQRLGQAKHDWQLWHLQTMQDTDLKDIADWLSYRQIGLTYPTWHLRLLNPFSIISSEREYTCIPGQQLLVRGDPPAHQMENEQTSVFLSLAPYSKSTTPKRQLPGSPARSQRLLHDSENYLCAPPPPSNQEYRLSISGEVTGRSIRVQAASPPVKLPAWLHGLHCTLVTGGKQHTMEAFSANLRSEPYLYQLLVSEDFSLEELAQAKWNYQPCDIPCSLGWEYISLQGKLCHDKKASLLTSSALTTWWQTSIWPVVSESPWVKLTLDAASFGNINLRLVLKSEGTPKKAWWTNAQYTANFFWLSKIVEQEAAQTQNVLPSNLSKTLAQHCVPGMPATLQNALMLLATSRNMPIWISLRLQAMLAVLHSTLELVPEERR